MDNSTENVTVAAGFITDLLELYQDIANTLGKDLFALSQDLDLSLPTNRVPIAVYNAMCEWIVNNLGPANIRKTGSIIGARIYAQMLATKNISADTSPIEIFKSFKEVAESMVQDPKRRGWTILDSGDNFCVLRRTQTYHPVLQEGLLKSLIQERKGVQVVRVEYVKSIAAGDEFDEYKVSWR